jgi:hypothetical protein
MSTYGTANPPTSVSGNGINYALVRSTVDYDNGFGPTALHLFRGMSASPSAGAITIVGASGTSYINWTIEELEADTGGTNGSAAIVQSAAQANGAPATTLSVTLGAFSDAGNGTICGLHTYNDATRTQGSGFTLAYDGSASGSPSTAYRTDNDTTADWSFSPSTRGGAIAIEVKPGSGPPPAPPQETLDRTGTRTPRPGRGPHSLGRYFVRTKLDAYPGPVAPAALDLVVADAAHAHAADNVTLSTGTALAVGDAAHGHAADNVTLSTGTALTVAEAAHGHAADNVVLTTDTTLSTAEASHGHAADNVTLTTDTALAVAEASHTHSADNVTLTLGGITLQVDDATHGHAADSLSLTTDSTLAVQDASHAHTAEAPTLSTDAQLAVQDAAHAHSADSPTFTLGGTNLEVQDALHAQAADALALTLDTTLSVQGALHSQSADNLTLAASAGGTAAPEEVWESFALEAGLTPGAMLRIVMAAVAGRTEGAGTDTERYFSVDGTKPRITATFDAAGNRTTIVLDGSP